MRKMLTAVRKVAVFVDRWHWLVLLLVVPLLMFPTPARSPFLLVVPGLWIIAGLAGKGFLPRTPLNGTVLVLEVMVLVSLNATYDIEVSLPKIAGLVLSFGVFFAVVRLGQERANGWKVYLRFLGHRRCGSQPGFTWYTVAQQDRVASANSGSAAAGIARTGRGRGRLSTQPGGWFPVVDPAATAGMVDVGRPRPVAGQPSLETGI